MILSLLAVEHGTDEAGEFIDLIFAGDVQIRLQIEAIEATLTDMALTWKARARPTHMIWTTESLLQNDLMFFKPLRDSVSCA